MKWTVIYGNYIFINHFVNKLRYFLFVFYYRYLKLNANKLQLLLKYFYKNMTTRYRNNNQRKNSD